MLLQVILEIITQQGKNLTGVQWCNATKFWPGSRIILGSSQGENKNISCNKLLPTPNFSDCATKRLGVFLGAQLAMAVKILSFVPAQLELRFGVKE